MTKQNEMEVIRHQLKTNASMVYINMLRGEIIKLPLSCILSLYPGQLRLVEKTDIEEDADTRI